MIFHEKFRFSLMSNVLGYLKLGSNYANNFPTNARFGRCLMRTCKDRGGAKWLLCDTSPRRGLCNCLMPDYACRCRSCILIMVPINFWRNSNPFRKENIFLPQKLTELDHFSLISQKC